MASRPKRTARASTRLPSVREAADEQADKSRAAGWVAGKASCEAQADKGGAVKAESNHEAKKQRGIINIRYATSEVAEHAFGECRLKMNSNNCE